MYIPVSVIQNDVAIFDLVTSIVAAEGLAPTNSHIFDGLGLVRSAATPYTGISSLNPCTDLLAVYDRLPKLQSPSETEGALFVHVADEGVAATAPLRPVPGVPGCRATAGAVLFDFAHAAEVDLVFLDANTLEICRGCLESPATKNEHRFRLRLATDEELSGARPLEVDLASAVAALFTPEERDEAARQAMRQDLRCGASLGARLADYIDQVSDHRRKYGRARELLAQLKTVLAGTHAAEEHCLALQKIVDVAEPTFISARMDTTWDPVYEALLQGFLDLAESFGREGWSWADNNRRAAFCQQLGEVYIEPALRRLYPDRPQMAASAREEIGLIVRRFREPNTFFVDDLSFRSAFVRALWTVMYSEGRTDRILEVVERYRGTATARLALAIFCGMKGYARLPYKQLALPPLDNAFGQPSETGTSATAPRSVTHGQKSTAKQKVPKGRTATKARTRHE